MVCLSTVPGIRAGHTMDSRCLQQHKMGSASIPAAPRVLNASLIKYSGPLARDVVQRYSMDLVFITQSAL